jgi:tetratricopeptide (TPR) repeat protein
MGWLSNLFGGGASLDGLRKAVEQKRFADARLLAEQLGEQALPDADAAEVRQLQTVAGDGLARLNLDEAAGFQRSGELERAAEHLQLALEQVCSAELRSEIEQLAEKPLTPTVEAPVPGDEGKSCGSCGPQILEPLSPDDLDLPDRDSQLELILTSYSPEIAERYLQKSDTFLQGFLLSHSGQDDAALPIWKQVASDERDELYWFELGAAEARSGQGSAARKSLEKALLLNPGLLPATEALIPLLISLGDADAALIHLQQMLDAGQDPAFCHAQLTLVRVQQQQPELAVGHARQALAAGVMDPVFLQLAASLLEQAGELDDVEDVLRRLPGGGCSGGLSLPLAEFLLRQERDLARVLDTFNDACRKDPQNPRWQLRVAQTYIARNWQKEGLGLLKKVVADPRLDAELRQEAELLLASQES